MERYNTSLIAFLKDFIMEDRWTLLQERVAERSRHVTAVLEDIYQPQNASALLRTSDIFGFQDIHIIENKHRYEVNPKVEKGSSKWLDLHRYRGEGDNSPRCLDTLIEHGYTLVATSPHVDAYSPENLPLDKPIAILFGTEKDGLRADTMERCTHKLRIPMYGFTESLNLSVSAGIILNRLRTRLESAEVDFKLHTAAQEDVLLDWLRKSLKQASLLEERFKEIHS
jgi:tRNA (guanosine-2'-O-)-methyltransferase